jgi:hypothetical protein
MGEKTSRGVERALQADRMGARQRPCPQRHRDKLVSRKVMLIAANPALPLMEIQASSVAT